LSNLWNLAHLWVWYFSKQKMPVYLIHDYLWLRFKGQSKSTLILPLSTFFFYFKISLFHIKTSFFLPAVHFMEDRTLKLIRCFYGDNNFHFQFFCRFKIILLQIKNKKMKKNNILHMFYFFLGNSCERKICVEKESSWYIF